MYSGYFNIGGDKEYFYWYATQRFHIYETLTIRSRALETQISALQGAGALKEKTAKKFDRSQNFFQISLNFSQISKFFLNFRPQKEKTKSNLLLCCSLGSRELNLVLPRTLSSHGSMEVPVALHWADFFLKTVLSTPTRKATS